MLNLDFAFLTPQVLSSYVLKGFAFSLQLTAIAMLGGIALGTALALMRLSGRFWLALPAAAYVNTMRSIPLVMVILWFFLLIPLIIGRPLGAEMSAVITFTLFEAAYYSEIMRAGIQSLPRGQRMAGLALGFTLPQTYRHVILPMAFRIVIPPLTSESMNIVKNSAVAFAVSISELTLFALQAQEETARGIEIYLAVTGLYFLSAFALNRVFHFVEARVRVPGMIGGGH